MVVAILVVLAVLTVSISANLHSLKLQGLRFPQVMTLRDMNSSNHEFRHRVHAQSSFTCSPAFTAFDPEYLCSDVVDYAYVLPYGYTPELMNAAAKQAASSLISLLNTQCLSDLKRLICANSYLPCQPGIVPDDVSTYPLLYGMIPFPYKRPCQSLCTATTYTGTSCAGLLEALGAAPDCNAIDPITTLPVYDSSNDPLQCNALSSTSTMQLVASPFEPYIGSVCKGIVTEYYVPPPQVINSNYAPLLPPFYLQTVTEYTLTAIEAQIPQYLTPECLVAQREILCTLQFMSPSKVSDLQLVFGDIYLPSYPDRDICTNYMSQCADIVKQVPALAMDCNAQASPGVDLFPTGPQVITAVDLGFGPIPLITPPFDPVVTVSFETQCPYGMDVPDNPELDGIVWITGTNCALECPLKLYSESEYQHYYRADKAAMILGFIASVFATFHAFLAPKAKRNIFVVILCINLLIQYFFSVIQLIGVGSQPKEMTCSSNTSWYTIESTMQSPQSALCAISGTVTMIMSFSSYWCTMAVVAELWCRIVWSMKDVSKVRYVYFHGFGLIVLVNVLIPFFVGDPQIVSVGGTDRGCIWRDSDTERFYFETTLPGTIYFSVSALLACQCLYQCAKITLRVSNGNESNPIKKLWKTYRTIILLALVFFFIYPFLIFMIGTTLEYQNSSKYVDSAEEWMICLVKNFVRSSDETYLEICGTKPSYRLEVGYIYFQEILWVVLPSLVVIITVSQDVKAFYLGHLPIWVQDKIHWNSDMASSSAKDLSVSRTVKSVPNTRASIYKVLSPTGSDKSESSKSFRTPQSTPSSMKKSMSFMVDPKIAPMEVEREEIIKSMEAAAFEKTLDGLTYQAIQRVQEIAEIIRSSTIAGLLEPEQHQQANVLDPNNSDTATEQSKDCSEKGDEVNDANDATEGTPQSESNGGHSSPMDILVASDTNDINVNESIDVGNSAKQSQSPRDPELPV